MIEKALGRETLLPCRNALKVTISGLRAEWNVNDFMLVVRTVPSSSRFIGCCAIVGRAKHGCVVQSAQTDRCAVKAHQILSVTRSIQVVATGREEHGRIKV